jgi:hypothetical protein
MEERQITADPGAFDRIEVKRTRPGNKWSWRIEIRDSPTVTRHLDLTRDELIAIGDHIYAELS